ncbi:MAG: hypothetical protein EU531_09000 [Promethearchaeota archaeon]|nr:MAG: hypothetical protein EU531_09000 [Candidatus Lokiarchaeota archaeon]
MPKRRGRKILHFYNTSGDLNKIILFLEDVQKKVNYLSLNATVEGKDIKITLFGPRDLQTLASERLRELANKHL